MSYSSEVQSHPHIALLPSSGMGHLMPFLRLAASLTAHDVLITLITAHPTVSHAESQTLSQFSTAFPQVTHQQMFIPPISQTAVSSDVDPFTLHYEAIRRSSHILYPLLSSLSPPISAVVTDMSLTSMVVPIATTLKLPNYILFTTCAKMLAIYSAYHKIVPQIEGEEDDFILPGMQPISKSWLPPPLLSQSNNLLKIQFKENGEKFLAAKGILINTFEELEKESLTALNSGLIVDQLPPVLAIGPLAPCAFERGEVLSWLDEQSPHSVLYISFGTRAAVSREQMRELGKGLARSGFNFLWVVKSKTVDREDQGELGEMMGSDIIEEVKKRGLMVKSWMKQEQVLSHTAIGGFLSHCGWNSVTEAIWHGIPILAWPQNADQKINADLVEKQMVGKWEKSWGWGAKELIEAEEIAQKVKEMMMDEQLKEQAKQIRNKARKAIGLKGSSQKQLIELIKSLS